MVWRGVRRLARIGELFAAGAILASAPTSHAQTGAPVPKPQPPEAPAPELPRGGIELRAPRVFGEQGIVVGPLLVNAFRVSGLSELSEAEVLEVVFPWIGRELDARELARAADAVTQYVRRRGWPVAQAYFPPQEARDGVVEIAVIEGRLGRVSVSGAVDARVGRRTVESFLRPVQPGAAIRSDNVERSLLLLNDLPGMRVAASLAPGAGAGVTDLKVSVQSEPPVGGYVVLDNGGVRSTGSYRADAGLRWRSPLGFGDVLSARVLRSTEGGQALGSLTYGLPVNGQGTRIGAQYSAQRYRLGHEFAPLEAHGESRAGSLLASHPLVRSNIRNVLLSASHTSLAFADRQEAVGFVRDSKQRIFGVALSGDRQDGWRGGGVSAFQAQVFRGRLRIESPLFAALDTAPGGLNASGSFTVMRARAQRAQTIDARSSLQASITAQRASKNLEAGTELALGGPDGVRAYPVGELYADEGYLARIEYLRAMSDSGNTTLSLFVDDARARINRHALPGDPANKRALSGYGVGVYHAVSRNVALQATAAWRTTERALSEADRSPRVWCSVAMQF